MTHTLMAAGHKSVGVITLTDSFHHPSLEARLSGHLQAVHDNGGTVDPTLVQRISISLSPIDIDGALDIMLASPTPPTAIVTSHDPVAARVIERLLHRGIRVPTELEVTGFDNSREFSHFRPRFTTTNPDFDSMGEVATEMLIDAIEANSMPTQTYILPVPIVKSDSAADRAESLVERVASSAI